MHKSKSVCLILKIGLSQNTDLENSEKLTKDVIESLSRESASWTNLTLET